MKILVTGAAGFVGKNLCQSLNNIKEKKDRTRPDLNIEEVLEYDVNTDPALLIPIAVRQILFSTWQGSTVQKSSRSLWKAISDLLLFFWIR